MRRVDGAFAGESAGVRSGIYPRTVALQITTDEGPRTLLLSPTAARALARQLELVAESVDQAAEADEPPF